MSCTPEVGLCINGKGSIDDFYFWFIANIPYPVPIGVTLVWIKNRRTIVIVIACAVPIRVGAGRSNAPDIMAVRLK